MTKVFVIDPVHEDGLVLLRARPDVALVHLPEPTEEAIAEHMADAEVLILRGRTLAPEHFARARRLRLVSRHGVGCDNLDLEALGARGVGVAIAADANRIAVAEHAFALMLAAAKRLPAADRAARSGGWGARDRLDTREIAGATLLILGFGRIGRAVAARAAAFEARVTVHDPFLPSDAVLPEGFARADVLEDAVSAADVVSLHLPLTAQTAGLVGAKLLSRFRPGAILVNTARGGIVDEVALAAALDAGAPAIYATDVLASEPPAADDPLLGRDDVILTPHSAATTAEGLRRMATGAAQNALDFIDGRLDPAMTVLKPRGAARAQDR